MCEWRLHRAPPQEELGQEMMPGRLRGMHQDHMIIRIREDHLLEKMLTWIMKAEEFEQKPHGQESNHLGGDVQEKMLTKTMMGEKLEMIICNREVVDFGGDFQEKMQIKITMDMSLGGACQEKMQTETVVILHQGKTDQGQEMTVRVMVMFLVLHEER